MSFPPSVLEQASDRKLGEPVRAFEVRIGLQRVLTYVPVLPARFDGFRTVYLFTDGLVLDGGGGRRSAYLWDDLVSVTASGVRHPGRKRTRYRFTVTAKAGEQISFGDELPDVRELGESLTAEVSHRVLPDYFDRVEAGGSVRIGPFEVGRDGIRREDETVPWPAVDEVDIDNGVVVVRTHDGVQTLTAIASQVPNAIAFVKLCEGLSDEDAATAS
jgi:hypothetical protein